MTIGHAVSWLHGSTADGQWQPPKLKLPAVITASVRQKLTPAAFFETKKSRKKLAFVHVENIPRKIGKDWAVLVLHNVFRTLSFCFVCIYTMF